MRWAVSGAPDIDAATTALPRIGPKAFLLYGALAPGHSPTTTELADQVQVNRRRIVPLLADLQRAGLVRIAGNAVTLQGASGSDARKGLKRPERLERPDPSSKTPLQPPRSFTDLHSEDPREQKNTEDPNEGVRARARAAVVALLTSQPLEPGNAEALVIARLRAAQCEVATHVRIGVGGRARHLDLVATWGPHQVAMMFDGRKPTLRAIERLRATPATTIRLLLLTNAATSWLPPSAADCDAVVVLPVAGGQGRGALREWPDDLELTPARRAIAADVAGVRDAAEQDLLWLHCKAWHQQGGVRRKNFDAAWWNWCHHHRHGGNGRRPTPPAPTGTPVNLADIAKRRREGRR